MKAIVGIVPNLPWWRLQNMSDEEIEAFNKKHLVEIDSVGIKARQTGSLSVYANEVWNEAIEAAALELNEVGKLLKILDQSVIK